MIFFNEGISLQLVSHFQHGQPFCKPKYFVSGGLHGEASYLDKKILSASPLIAASSRSHSKLRKFDRKEKPRIAGQQDSFLDSDKIFYLTSLINTEEYANTTNKTILLSFISLGPPLHCHHTGTQSYIER